MKRYLLPCGVLILLLGAAPTVAQSDDKSEGPKTPAKSSDFGKSTNEQRTHLSKKASTSQPKSYQPAHGPKGAPQPPTMTSPGRQSPPPPSRPRTWEPPQVNPPARPPHANPPARQPRSEPPTQTGGQKDDWQPRGYERPPSYEQPRPNNQAPQRPDSPQRRDDGFKPSQPHERPEPGIGSGFGPGIGGPAKPPTRPIDPGKPRDLEPGLRFTPRTGGAPPQTDFNLSPKTGGPSILSTPAALPSPSNPAREGVPYLVTPGVYRQSDLRVGYYHYDRWWLDRYFGYRYYCYDPWIIRCYFSPYYWYIFLPGYISCDRVIIVIPKVIICIGPDIYWTYCGSYGYYYGSYGYTYNKRSYSDLDRALSDIVDAFRYEDASLLAPFLPRNGNVDIYIDGHYSYSLSSDDYYDMTADLIYSVNTTRFDIVQVRRARSGEYRVVARHDFLDPNDRPQTVWMTFTLEPQRYGFAIVQAGTSRFRPSL